MHAEFESASARAIKAAYSNAGETREVVDAAEIRGKPLPRERDDRMTGRA